MGSDMTQQPHAAPPAGQPAVGAGARDDDRQSADIVIKAGGIYSMAETREADARLDEGVGALAVIVSGPGADGWLARGRSGVRRLRHVGSHREPPGR